MYIDFRVDPTATALTLPGSVFLRPSVSVTLAVSVTLRNDAAATSGNDIPNVNVPDANYKIRVRMSDVDMKTSTDTLALSSVFTVMTSDMTQALNTGLYCLDLEYCCKDW